VGAAVVSPSPDHRPARALLPAPLARLAGFAALVALGALEWARLVEAPGSGRALSWAAIACLTGAAIVACDRLAARRRGPAVLGTAGLGVAGALAASGVPLAFAGPREWGRLADGLATGAEALGGVRLPYAGADPWPAWVVGLAGALLCVLAALLAFWPRRDGRGFPFLALAVLLVLVATPVVSLGGARPVVLGLALAALSFGFLWLERLPPRPGLGVAALVGIALAGALPVAGVADRGDPWFDYRAFAESLGPQDPIRFDFDHGTYGPITWPRNGSEVLRVRSEQPQYLKMATLDTFDGDGWREGDGGAGLGLPVQQEVPEDYANRPAWTDNVTVSVRRLRTTAVPAPGTIIAVDRTTRRIRGEGTPGRFRAESELRRGDSYTAMVHAPRPTGVQLAAAASGEDGRQAADLVVEVPLIRGAWDAVPRAPGGTPVTKADVVFGAFGESLAPSALYPTLEERGDGVAALRHSPYARTWALAQRLRAGAGTPFEYLQAIDRHLQEGFTYSETPAPIAPGRAPLDAFLFDTREGYCQHFSGAMALLLRMGGVPARAATGFSPGGFSRRKDAWIVRDTDAHSWVEAWFDSFGWVTFDPTPASTPARSQIAALEEPSGSSQAAESGAGAGAPGPDAAGDPSGGRGSPLRYDLRREEPAGGVPDGGTGGAPWWPWAVAGGVALLLTVLALWIVRRRGPRVRTRRNALDRAIAELETALRRSGRPPAPGTTLRQLEERLGGGSPEAAAYLRALRAGRYAAAAPEPTAAQRRALRRELAAGLGLTGRIRAFVALPPRPR
jgi:transglutaminase-like putative cysteine protease